MVCLQFAPLEFVFAFVFEFVFVIVFVFAFVFIFECSRLRCKHSKAVDGVLAPLVDCG